MPEPVTNERIAPRAPRQRFVESELEPRKTVVVDAGVTEHLGGDRMLRIEAPLFRIEPESGDVQALKPLGAYGIRLALDVDEAVSSVRELLVHLFRIEPQDARDDRCGFRRVPNLQRIGVDRDRLLADGELNARAVVDRAAVRSEVDGRAVLARRHPAERLRAHALQPDRAKNGGAEHDREESEEKADPTVREPAAQRPRRFVRST